MSISHTIAGRCHCGNLCFELRTEVPPADIVARACDCGFCRMHGTRNWSDPRGTASIRVADESRLQRYRFGLRAADFLVCTTCGGYAGAVLCDDEGAWSTLNLRLTALAGVDERPARYGEESREDRLARRKRVWTPTTVEILG